MSPLRLSGSLAFPPVACECGKGTGTFFRASISLRIASGSAPRFRSGGRPRIQHPASRPPIAAPITSCTAARLSPRRAISALSTLISMNGRPAHLLDPNIGCPFEPAQDRRNLVGGSQHWLEVLTEHFHRDVATHAREKLVEAHLDRLGELVVIAGQRFIAVRLHALTSSSLGSAGSGHCCLRFQNDEGIATRSAAWDRRPSRRCRSWRNTYATSGNSPTVLSTSNCIALRLCQRRARDSDRVQPRCSFHRELG